MIGGNLPFYFAQICSRRKGGADGPILWIILDEAARAAQNLDFTVGETVEADMYFSAETIANLAQKIGVPAAALADSMARYNTLQAAGVDDDFGRDGHERTRRRRDRSTP